MNTDTRNLLILIINFYFSYYLPVWKVCNWKSKRQVSKLWRVLYLTNEIFSHQRWLNALMNEIQKCLPDLSLDIMNDPNLNNWVSNIFLVNVGVSHNGTVSLIREGLTQPNVSYMMIKTIMFSIITIVALVKYC